MPARKKPDVIGFRVTKEEKDRISFIAQSNGKTTAELAYEALNEYLDPEAQLSDIGAHLIRLEHSLQQQNERLNATAQILMSFAHIVFEHMPQFSSQESEQQKEHGNRLYAEMLERFSQNNTEGGSIYPEEVAYVIQRGEATYETQAVSPEPYQPESTSHSAITEDEPLDDDIPVNGADVDEYVG